MPEAAQPQVASPPEKPCRVREVWRSQTCARSRLSLLPFFGEAKKGSARAGMRRKGKRNMSGEGYLKFGKPPKINLYDLQNIIR